MIEYELIAKPNAYGFGHDWTLVLSKNGEQKHFWLGQDVKVISRILGMRMAYAVEHYKKKANSSNFDVVKEYIAADILREKLNTQRLTQEQLEKLWKRPKWDLAVQ
jgi:hypothetical protein